MQEMERPNKIRIFMDADALFAASASSSKTGASLIILTLSQATLLDVVTSELVITEVERNLTAKIPNAIPKFRELVNASLHVVPNVDDAMLKLYTGKADEKDLPILVAAAQHNCPILITFNVRHFRPGLPDVEVLRPGEFIQRVRSNLIGV